MTSQELLPTHDEFQFMMMMHAVLPGMQNSYLLAHEAIETPDMYKRPVLLSHEQAE